MLNPRRLLNIPALGYPGVQTDERDDYNNPLPNYDADPLELMVWAWQVTSSEATTDEDTAHETWTVYVRPTDDDGQPIAGLDFLSRLEVPSLALQLTVVGNPTPWIHPRSRALILYEVTGATTDEAWVS